ncbi:MAG: FkbM family methyltransferase [Terrimicrobiaceae bacterium]
MLHIDCTPIFKEYGFPSGIIHVGGNDAEEEFFYRSIGAKSLWFEPIPWKAKQIEDKGIKVYCSALGASEKTGKLKIASNSQSSSLLAPKTHLTHYPEISFISEIEVQIKTLDSYELSDFDMLILDTQGFELEVLIGAKKTLENIRYVYTEFAVEEVFEGNAYFSEIQSLLGNSWKPVEKWMEEGKGWGEALFVR